MFTNRNKQRFDAMIFGLLVALATVCFLFGVMLPILKLTRFYLWTDTFSIISVIWTLYQDGEYFLSTILTIFSIIFPIIKIFILTALKTFPLNKAVTREKLLDYLGWLGKWSMLDVLVLALTVFYIKSTGFAEAASLPGIYFFAASVILTMLATAQAKRIY